MEQRDYDSRTALHVAAAEGDVSSHMLCSLLMECGHFSLWYFHYIYAYLLFKMLYVYMHFYK